MTRARLLTIAWHFAAVSLGLSALSAAAQPAPAPSAAPVVAPAPGAAPAPTTAAPVAPVEATTPPATPEPAASPSPAPEPMLAAPAPEPMPMLAAEPAPEAPPATATTDKPKLHVGVGLRAGLDFDPKGAAGRAQLRTDQLNVRPYFSGQLNDYIGFEGNLDASTGGVVVLDAIGKFHFDDLANIWVGQFLAPSDRANLSGPYYQNAWNFPTFVQGFPFDYAGRDRGTAFWGQVAGGQFKYQLGLFDLEPGNPIKNSRFAARLVANFLDPEPGYYNSSTYYGQKEILALGGTLQYQNPDNNITGGGKDKLLGIEVDALYEHNMQESGVLSLEGSYWNFKGTDPGYQGNTRMLAISAVGMPMTTGFVSVNPTAQGQSFFLLAAWMTHDKIGIGNIQPMARLEFIKLVGIKAAEKIDGGINYIIDGHNLRLALVISHTVLPGQDVTEIQAGTQIQM